MTVPARWTVVAVVAVGLAAGAVELMVDGALDALLASVAGLLAAATGALGASLVPRVDWRGLVVGGVFFAQGVLSWTYTNTGIVVWTLLLLSGLLFLFWAAPVSNPGALGTAWLGVSYWLIGILGALLVLKVDIAAQRLLYAGYFGLVVLVVLAFRGPRFSLGIAVSFLFGIAVLLLAGSGNLFTTPHVVPDTPWGAGFEYRFWGMRWLLLHPNAMALAAMLAAIRVGADRSLAAWQRIGAVAVSALILCVSDSRTGFLLLAVATLTYALISWRDALVPFVALMMVLVVNGPGFLLRERYGSDAGVSSGRVETWRQVAVDWRADSPPEQLLGNTRDARATVYRASSGADIKLTVDNAPIAAFRKAGVAGALAFAAGLLLLLWNVWRRRANAPPWLLVLLPAALLSAVTNEWLIGGTGGILWLLLLAAEADVVRRSGPRPDEWSPGPAPAVGRPI
ncbi:hypothetical protein ACFFX1_25325 [Dactylosporangium sucinum]|uniref:Uncharacterized protein n=1 Tax=Dactylosporangium sucinum TaxID=1424081 RepID=A0A917T6C0_9ACTN|nr:hypothetical protein [Dactylosporangium sucinum]GGM10871.1 hypothetical protein GCM10007977_009970 [Dactylosporangium sucinum]